MVNRHAAGALDEFVTEAALPRARLPGDQDHRRPTRPRLAERPFEDRELAIAPDEAREATRPRAVEAAPYVARTPQLEHAHRSAGALETLLPTVDEVEEAGRQSRGRLRHCDAAGRRKLLHPRGEADHVPLRGVVHA